MLVGVNGLLALEAIDKQLLDGLLQKAIKLEGSGDRLVLVCEHSHLACRDVCSISKSSPPSAVGG